MFFSTSYYEHSKIQKKAETTVNINAFLPATSVLHIVLCLLQYPSAHPHPFLFPQLTQFIPKYITSTSLDISYSSFLDWTVGHNETHQH